MRVWHSAWSWLKLIVAAESVAGNTRTGMLTRLILRKPFQVGLAAMGGLSAGWHPGAIRLHRIALACRGGSRTALLPGAHGVGRFTNRPYTVKTRTAPGI